MKDTSRYDDIIDLPHHVSEKYPPMSRLQRAAQFSPFAALAGYHESVDESARYTETRIELDENMRAELDIHISDALKQKYRVRIEHFAPDAHKQGGEYVSHCGIITKIVELQDTIVMDDGTSISMSDIIGIYPER